MANVFISHRRSDIKEAERLAEEVRRAGHQVWFDEWEINIGDSIIERMNQGLSGTAYVVVCYSSAGIEAPWMGREWLSALARQLDRRGVTILPVVLTGGAPPAILADIKYADLTTDWSAGIKLLLRAVK